jgi:photosynthetic reaction center H subunit
MRDDAYNTPRGAGTMEAGTASNIAPLKTLKDFKVAEGDPDVRGWKVISRDGREIGEVHDLLVDTAAMRVRYLDVDLDHDLLRSVPNLPGTSGPVLGRDHHVLIPIGYAHLDEDHDRIHMEHMDSDDVAVLPTYDHNAFNREYETGLRRRFDRDYTPATPSAADRDFYTGDAYDDSRFYGPRRRRRGLFGR